MLKKEYVEGIYAGWLAKIIGIRLGAPIEGWTYEQIKKMYGECTGYPVDYKDFAADDDSNGPLFFLRALEDSNKEEDLETQDVAEALLNYAPFEHGFFWWGGYGISTEHTAYLNLRNGMKAPMSGSIAQNGATTAEQIGGQIFIDTWGLVTPGNPDLAAKLAEKAASVTHGGNGVYGGIFVAACISYAFVEKDMRKIIEKGLSYIPQDSEYAIVVREIMEFYDQHPQSWEECFKYIRENRGYKRYPGMCHIIPNIAVMILALMYGEGDFSDTLNICNRCGWDTDCNVGNVATIMGVRNGLEGIDYKQWRAPINDFLACSSVVGSLNIMDIPYGAAYIAKLAAKLAGVKLPAPFDEITEKRIDSCHFEYPGSTHAIRVRREDPKRSTLEVALENTTESAHTGNRSLKVVAKPAMPASGICIYKKTYYRPRDFHDSRYDPSFSPTLYPGQTIHGSIMVPAYGSNVKACLYVKEMRSGRIYQSELLDLEKETWMTLEYQIPELDGAVIEEMGFCVYLDGDGRWGIVTVLIDDLYADGKAAYSVDMSKENVEFWNSIHQEISQFTKLKGLMYLADGQLNLSCADFAEAYTGRHDWKDYSAEFVITPVTGEWHMANVRVQGAIRSYAVGLLPNHKVGILKNANGYKVLIDADFFWEAGKEYIIKAEVNGNEITAYVDGEKVLTHTDTESPYLEGCVGISLLDNSHLKCKSITIR